MSDDGKQLLQHVCYDLHVQNTVGPHGLQITAEHRVQAHVVEDACVQIGVPERVDGQAD